MIFVTIGNSPFNFNRLLKEMDRIAGEIDEEVLMQIGPQNFQPEHANFFSYVSNKEIEEIYRKSRIVICHAGVGSILTCIKYNKIFIVVPRRLKYGEHFDDHQIQITKELEKEKIIKVVYDMKNLKKEIENISEKMEPFSKQRVSLINNIKNYLSSVQEPF